MTRIAIHAPFSLGVAVPRASGLLARIVAGSALRRSRRGLAGLDDHLLRDIGLSRDEALLEAARPTLDALDLIPWNVPAHWLR